MKLYDFKGVRGFKLGWSLFGPPLMTAYCYVIGDLMIDTAQSHMQKEVLQIAKDKKIKKIYLTHHHEDHSGNAAAIQKALNAMVYGHAITIQKMASPFKILPYQKYVWGRSKPLKMEALPLKIDTDYGTIIPIHTPGHSRDHRPRSQDREPEWFPPGRRSP